MSDCSIVIPADSAQVRVARLVATAAARRAGLDEELVDDVRLAVGEALARAVLRGEGVDSATVSVRLFDEGGRFAVEVSDSGSRDGEEAGFAMAVIAGLVPDAVVSEGPTGGQILSMSWSASN